jgi:prolyl-tRNA synthetase
VATRASQLFIPTLRDDPGDAEAPSHRLLLRGGFIRQVGAGLYTFLPLGWKVHQKIVQIIREEMDAIGAQEMYEPVLTPAELWEKTGRYASPEVFKVQGRDRRYVLALSHEETMAFHARELQSYRELPQAWYQFAVKGRDEPRPRGGLLRMREFIMKDSYSLDRDDEGLARSFDLHERAYRKIFDRCGLDYYVVEADVGLMGGELSIEFQAPCAVGEDTIAICSKGDYKANVQVARSRPAAPEFPRRLDAPEAVETPGIATIDDLARFLELDPRATSKAFPVVADGKVVLALVRGDHRVNEFKLTQTVGPDWRPAHPDEIRETFGAEGGSLGPVGVGVEVVADEALREGQFVAGANRTGWHLLGVEAGRDFEPARWADIRVVEEGDTCPACDGTLRLEAAIEVGNIFKLGTRYSEALGATYLDEGGTEHPIVMGSYGIGPGRTMAAIVEQHNDEQGIAWPESVAPYEVHVVALPGAEEIAERAAAAIEARGRSVLVDDRDRRAGEKFADADLIGCPVRVTAGKKSLEDGAVDVRDRATGEERRVAVEDL